MSIMTLNLNNQEHDFIVQNIPGDGDCGYTAFANWLNLKKQKNFDKEDSISLRRKVAKYINDHWEDDDWKDADGSAIKLKEVAKHEIAAREKHNQDFSRYQIKIDVEQDDDDTIKEKYCNFIAEPKKFWISDLEFSILERIFAKKVFIVNRTGESLRGDLSEVAAIAEDSFYTVYNGVHYNLLINIKKYIADSWLKLTQESNMFLHAVASRIKQEAEWLQNKENNILEALLTFLNTQSKEKLTEFYKELGQFFKKGGNHQDKKSTAPGDNEPKNPLMETFKFLFDTSPSGDLMSNFVVFFGRMKFLWHKLTVMFNPGVPLEDCETSGEYEKYGTYKDIFEIAQEPGRKFYRKVLAEVESGEKLTDKQFLNKFLHALKHDSQKLFSKKGHDICTALEEIVLGDENNFISNIEQNLQNAFKHYNSKEHTDEDKGDLIKTATDYAKKLREKIEKLKDEIIQEDETDENKNKLFKTLQNDRLKLVHFALKMQAFSKGETLTNKKSFRSNFKKYVDKLSAVQEITKLAKDLKDRGETEADIQNELKEKQAHIKPCGIFKLFELQYLQNNLKSKTNYDETLKKIRQDRSKELEKRRTHVSQETANLIDEFERLRQDFQEHATQYYNDNNVENQLVLVTDKIKELRRQIDNHINIKDAISKQEYYELLSKLTSKDSVFSRFKNKLSEWQDLYVGLNSPSNTVPTEEPLQAEPEDYYYEEPGYEEGPEIAPSGSRAVPGF